MENFVGKFQEFLQKLSPSNLAHELWRYEEESQGILGSQDFRGRMVVLGLCSRAEEQLPWSDWFKVKKAAKQNAAKKGLEHLEDGLGVRLQFSSLAKKKGALNGRNQGSPGYKNNTRVSSLAIATNPDFHCVVPARNGKMKCKKCFDYNRGVKLDNCRMCGSSRFKQQEVSAEHADDDLSRLFEEQLQISHSWSEEDERNHGINVVAIQRIVKRALGGCPAFQKPACSHISAMHFFLCHQCVGCVFVEKAGSVRKATSIKSSDIDLRIVSASVKNPVVFDEPHKQKLLQALRLDSFVKSAEFAKVAIKVVFTNGGAPVDLVFSKSAFAISYMVKPDLSIRADHLLSETVRALKVCLEADSSHAAGRPSGLWLETLVSSPSVERGSSVLRHTINCLDFVSCASESMLSRLKCKSKPTKRILDAARRRATQIVQDYRMSGSLSAFGEFQDVEVDVEQQAATVSSA